MGKTKLTTRWPGGEAAVTRSPGASAPASAPSRSPRAWSWCAGLRTLWEGGKSCFTENLAKHRSTSLFQGAQDRMEAKMGTEASFAAFLFSCPSFGSLKPPGCWGGFSIGKKHRPRRNSTGVWDLPREIRHLGMGMTPSGDHTNPPGAGPDFPGGRAPVLSQGSRPEVTWLRRSCISGHTGLA